VIHHIVFKGHQRNCFVFSYNANSLLGVMFVLPDALLS